MFLVLATGKIRYAGIDNALHISNVISNLMAVATRALFEAGTRARSDSAYIFV